MRVVVFCHSLVSDWNHGNAHFLRGVTTELAMRGQDVRVFEPREAWSVMNLVRDHGEEALYLSIGAYSTAGWADVHPPSGWRVVMSLESVNGLLMVGWSTAFFFHNITRLMVTDESHPLPMGAIALDSPRPRRSGKGSPPRTNSSETELMQ
jgi:hypothetical protein